MSIAFHPDQQPEFALAMRGYDRDQVDEYVARLAAWLTEWRQRAAGAEAAASSARAEATELRRQVSQLKERSSTPESIEALGERVAGILKAAFTAAEEMRAEAAEETAALRAEASAEVDQLRSEARAEVEELRRQSEELRAGARAQVEAEIRALVQRRDAVVSHLGALQRDLMGVLNGRPVTEGGAEAPGSPDGEAGPVTEVLDLRDGVRSDATDDDMASSPAG